MPGEYSRYCSTCSIYQWNISLWEKNNRVIPNRKYIGLTGTYCGYVHKVIYTKESGITVNVIATSSIGITPNIGLYAIGCIFMIFCLQIKKNKDIEETVFNCFLASTVFLPLLIFVGSVVPFKMLSTEPTTPSRLGLYMTGWYHVFAYGYITGCIILLLFYGAKKLSSSEIGLMKQKRIKIKDFLTNTYRLQQQLACMVTFLIAFYSFAHDIVIVLSWAGIAGTIWIIHKVLIYITKTSKLKVA